MSKRAILLVEDNPDDELLTVDALKMNNVGNDIVVARNGVEALDYLYAKGAYTGRDVQEIPAVVLLDLKLPKVDGLEVLRNIRNNKNTRFLPVVVLTTSSEDEDRIKSYELGANSYVRKPVDFDQFLKAAGQLGLYWLLLNEVAPMGHR